MSSFDDNNVIWQKNYRLFLRGNRKTKGPQYLVGDHRETGNGDLEFSQSAGYGGSKFFFVEDCYINNTRGNHSPDGGMDATIGAKFVVRHCHLFNVEILGHGTELNRWRGGRAQEIYNNDYHWSYDTTMDGIRSGSLIAHDNTFSGNLPTAYGFQTYRLFTLYPNTPWLAASGDNRWDVNVTEPDGTHVDGHPPYLFESGTVTSGSENCPAGLQYLTDTSKNWTPNQWAGYTARRLSDNWIGEIISNTNNTLTMYFYYSGGGCISTWRANDQYQIHQVLVALDQPGRARRSDYWRSAYQQHDRNGSVAASGVEAMLFMEQYPFAGGRAYKFHSHFNVSRNSFTEPRLLQRYHSSGIHALRLSASVGKRFSYAYPDTNCHSDADAYAECNPDYYTNADADGATTSKAKAPPSSVTV